MSDVPENPIPEGHRARNGNHLPVCLDGDRLVFLVQCWPTIETYGVCVQKWEPAGASWDGASIPRVFWSIFGHPLEQQYRWASYWHDRLCESAKCIEDRTIADAVFLRLLKAAGVPKLRRLAMWAAVRVYGVLIWRARRGECIS